MIFYHLLNYEKNLKSGAHEVKKLVLELQFLISFCILVIYKDFPTYNKNLESGAHDVKIRQFLSEHLKGSD